MARYSEETKAAVLAALLQGQSQAFVSKEYKVPQTTLRHWKRAHDAEVSQNLAPKKEIGALLLEYLQANLNALRVQAEFFTDEQWLKRQSAAEIATLHGVMTDKSIRLIEAMERNAASD